MLFTFDANTRASWRHLGLSTAIVFLGGQAAANLEPCSGLTGSPPCTGTQVEVPDRTKVVPNASETQVLQPPALQPLIDQAVAAFTSGAASPPRKSALPRSGSVPPGVRAGGDTLLSICDCLPDQQIAAVFGM